MSKNYLWYPSSFPFPVSFKRVSLSFVIADSSHSSSAVLGLASFFLSLSFPFYATDFILFLLHTSRPWSSAAVLFHLRYSFAYSVPFSWKPMLLPSRIGTDAEGRLRREGSTFFLTFLLYMDSTVRPLGANRWHAEVEMLPT